MVRRYLLFAVLAALLGIPAVASASTVTVGSPLTASFASNNFLCGPCTEFNLTLGEPGANATSPVSGRIVRWRISGNAGGSAFRLRVLRPAANGQYTGAGSSSPTVPTGTGVSTFSTDLPIKAGDTIGLDLPNAVWYDAYATSVAGSSSSGWNPPLADGSTASPTIPTHSGTEFAFNADVVPQPSITVLGPLSGPSSGGTRVVIAGTDFTGASAVRFGSSPSASFSIDSDGAITAFSPSHAGGTVDITVTTAGGTSPTSAADRFTYAAAPIRCVVPRLRGDTLARARTTLTAAGCKLGTVTKPKHHRGRLVVKSQAPKAGRALTGGANVSLKLGSKRRGRRR